MMEQPRAPVSTPPPTPIGGASKYRDARNTGRAAIVIDDVLPPWTPRGIEVRGRAEVIEGPVAIIRVHPRRIVSWGIEEETIGRQFARTVDSATAPDSGS